MPRQAKCKNITFALPNRSQITIVHDCAKHAHLIDWKTSLIEKHDADGVRPAVTCHGASGTSFKDFLEASIFTQRPDRGLYSRALGSWVNNKDRICPTVRMKSKQLFRILIHTMLEGATILFPHSHFAVMHFNAGLEMHDVCTQCSNRGTASALFQIIQSINEKT